MRISGFEDVIGAEEKVVCVTILRESLIDDGGMPAVEQLVSTSLQFGNLRTRYENEREAMRVAGMRNIGKEKMRILY